ncbi:hypothetical protein JCM10450v2_004476 [Rhodotorula kratochvilovae]
MALPLPTPATPLASLLNLADFERSAKATLKPKSWAYYSSTADDGWTAQQSQDIWSQIRFRPRVLQDVDGEVDLRTSTVGCESRLPFMISPAAMGTPLLQPSKHASVPHQDLILAALPLQTLFFQLYVHRERWRSEKQLAEAKQVGFKAITFTVDVPTPGNRELDLRTGLDENAVALANPGPEVGKKALAVAATTIDASVAFKDIVWVKKVSGGLPVLVKGIQCYEDALGAVAAGADGLVLSNNGGRQVDISSTPLEILLELRHHAPHLLSSSSLSIILDGGMLQMLQGPSTTSAPHQKPSERPVDTFEVYLSALVPGYNYARHIDRFRKLDIENADQLELIAREPEVLQAVLDLLGETVKCADGTEEKGVALPWRLMLKSALTKLSEGFSTGDILKRFGRICLAVGKPLSFGCGYHYYAPALGVQNAEPCTFRLLLRPVVEKGLARTVVAEACTDHSHPLSLSKTQRVHFREQDDEFIRIRSEEVRKAALERLNQIRKTINFRLSSHDLPEEWEVDLAFAEQEQILRDLKACFDSNAYESVRSDAEARKALLTRPERSTASATPPTRQQRTPPQASRAKRAPSPEVSRSMEEQKKCIEASPTPGRKVRPTPPAPAPPATPPSPPSLATYLHSLTSPCDFTRHLHLFTRPSISIASPEQLAFVASSAPDLDALLAELGTKRMLADGTLEAGMPLV